MLEAQVEMVDWACCHPSKGHRQPMLFQMALTDLQDLLLPLRDLDLVVVVCRATILSLCRGSAEGAAQEPPQDPS
eukprot:4669534-Prorocentrum_lima.AAC.1